ncbi:hypothetical protein D3C85_1630290 [compost metagenome]
MVLEEPASAGFFMGAGKVLAAGALAPAAFFYRRSSFAAARSVISVRSFNEPAARLRASSNTLAGAVSGLPAWNGGAGAYSSCNCTSSAVS